MHSCVTSGKQVYKTAFACCLASHHTFFGRITNSYLVRKTDNSVVLAALGNVYLQCSDLQSIRKEKTSHSFIRKESLYGRQAQSFALVPITGLGFCFISKEEMGGAAMHPLNKFSYML